MPHLDGFHWNSLSCSRGAPKRMNMVGIGIGIGIAIDDHNRLLETNNFDSDCDSDPEIRTFVRFYFWNSSIS
jgi:hypothetical protein